MRAVLASRLSCGPCRVYDSPVVNVPLLFIGGLGAPEMIIVLMIGLLLFGSKLPEVGRQLGRSLMEFKKGVKGFTDDMHAAERDTERLIAEAEENERRRQATRDAAAAAAAPLPGSEPPADPARPSVADQGRDPAANDVRG